ncbi:MAG: hypothetical protein KDB14_29035 [Planctomycetales bacterium]|nr:hypothetical protein [Planctomycetales bacterium]
MGEPNPKVFANPVVFALNSGESFSIIPGRYLDFNSADAPASNLIAADFELTSGDVSRIVGDYIVFNEFVELREFLTRAETAKIGEAVRFTSKEKVVALTLTRQEATLRIAGQFPTDESPWVHYSDFQSELEKRFETQVSFYCNFPFDKTPAVVDQMDKILQAIDYPGQQEAPP